MMCFKKTLVGTVWCCWLLLVFLKGHLVLQVFKKGRKKDDVL